MPGNQIHNTRKLLAAETPFRVRELREGFVIIATTSKNCSVYFETVNIQKDRKTVALPLLLDSISFFLRSLTFASTKEFFWNPYTLVYIELFNGSFLWLISLSVISCQNLGLDVETLSCLSFHLVDGAAARQMMASCKIIRPPTEALWRIALIFCFTFRVGDMLTVTVVIV